MGHSFFNTASFGKRVEYIIIARMLRDGLDIYLPMVDDKGIDCLIRKVNGSIIEIQIKGRSKNVDPKDAARFSALSITPRPNYFIIFYSELCGIQGTSWLISSIELSNIASQNKNGNNVGKFAINLCGIKSNKDGDKFPYPNKKYSRFIISSFSEDMF